MQAHTPPLALLLLPVASTLLGGLFALRLRSHMPVLLALGAGSLLGAAALDLIPEAFSLGAMAHVSRLEVMGLALVSFLAFLLLDKLIDRVGTGGTDGNRSTVAGRVAASMMIFHSFRDGMAIGASYAVLPQAGYAVALGIAAHDFADGLNTVLLTTRGRTPSRADYLFLVADAIAPLAGGAFALWYFSSLTMSVVLLAAAAGFFLQMAVYDLLPQLRRLSTSRSLLALYMLAGVLLVFLANWLLRSATR